MSIQVVCLHCQTRFKVSDKFAGKSGACPKCKGKIQVPDLGDEVVIHEPEHSESGAKDATGQYVLKPVSRTDSKFNPLILVAVVVVVIAVFAVALMMGGDGSGPRKDILAIGALLVAFPLGWAGYFFLRDDELEAYKGKELAVRTAICSLAYAALWGLYAWLYPMILGDTPVEAWDPFLFVMVVPILALGSGAAYVCYDISLGSGFFHYCLYLFVTVLLRWMMGLPPL